MNQREFFTAIAGATGFALIAPKLFSTSTGRPGEVEMPTLNQICDGFSTIHKEGLAVRHVWVHADDLRKFRKTMEPAYPEGREDRDHLWGAYINPIPANQKRGTVWLQSAVKNEKVLAIRVNGKQAASIYTLTVDLNGTPRRRNVHITKEPHDPHFWAVDDLMPRAAKPLKNG